MTGDAIKLLDDSQTRRERVQVPAHVCGTVGLKCYFNSGMLGGSTPCGVQAATSLLK